MAESTQPIVIQVAPADVDPDRIAQMGELALLLLGGAIAIWGIRQIAKLFEAPHERE